MRIDCKLHSFEAMKINLHTSCQVKIAYHYRKYIKAKKIRLEMEAKRKAKRKAAQKGKKSKKKAVKKSTTMKTAQVKEIESMQFEKTSSIVLEPGQQSPKVEITVDGVELADSDQEDKDEEVGADLESVKSKATIENDEDDFRREATLGNLGDTPLDLNASNENEGILVDDDGPPDNTKEDEAE